MRDLRCFVVTDHRRERGYQHQGAVHILFDLLQIRFGAIDQELAEVGAAIGHDCDRVGDVEDHQRLVNVHFEIAARAAETHRDVIGHDLHSDHGEGFTLGGVDLAWHDRRARLVFRDRQFGKSGARPARHQANVIADLVEGHC